MPSPRIAIAFVLAGSIAALPGRVASAAAGDVVDQQNLPADYRIGQSYNTSASSNLPMGQEFRPTLAAVDFVDLVVQDAAPPPGNGASFTVRLRQASIDGLMLALSDPVFVPDNTNIGGGGILTRFQFASPVAVAPGATYVWEVRQVGGDFGSFFVNGDLPGAGAYPHGRAIRGGVVRSADDFWFRVGLAVPEPGSVALALLAALAAAWGRRVAGQKFDAVDRLRAK
jgi:hypothetical protein